MTDRNANRPGYQKTRLGWIPEDWDVHRLDEIAKITMGQSPKSEFYNLEGEGLPLIQGNSDIENRKTKPRFWTSEVTKKCQPGDLILSVRAPVGSVAKSNHAGCIGRGVCSISCPKSSNFLFQLLVHMEPVWNRYAQGSTFEAVVSTDVRGFKIPYPPIEEQQKIAEILSTWDRAIEQTRALIDAKQRFKRGLMQQLLTGRLRFPGFGPPAHEKGELPVGWRMKPLNYFLKTKLRKEKKPDKPFKKLGIRSHGKGVFLHHIDDPDQYAMKYFYRVREDDIVVNITFAWEGAIAHVGREADGALVSHRFPTYIVDKKRVLVEYFKYLIHTSRFFYDLGVISPGGAGRNRVMRKTDFLKIKVMFPKLDEQRNIAKILTDLDNEIEWLEKLLMFYKSQKKGLMQKLLSGQVRAN